MIVIRAYYREVLQTTLVVAMIFIALFVVVSLVGLMSKAVTGKLPVQAIFVMLGMQTLKNLDLILPLSLFIGILMALGRWYRDSEMAVLNACGVGLLRFLRPTLFLALTVAVVVGVTTFYLRPLASSYINKVRADTADPRETGVATGIFQSIDRGTVVYIERTEEDGVLRDVFVSSVQLERPGVLFARSAFEYTDKSSGDRYLVLQHGHRYEGVPGEADYRILQFERYGLRVTPRPSVEPPPKLDETPTGALLASADRSAQAEWQWRLSKPLSLFALVLFALVFAHTDTRRGRFGNLFIAMFIYFAYANALGVGQALLRQGRLPLELGLWGIHALFALLALYLLWRRAQNRELLPIPPSVSRR